MEFFAPALLALALSIDGFGVGLSYGLRKIKVSLLPILLITLCSLPAMTFTLLLGQLAASFIPYRLAGIMGGIILMGIGFWQLVEGLKKYKDDPLLLCINLKALGVVLQIIREPARADRDNSGEINCREAILLGTALNIDVMGAGFGAGMAGYSLYLIPSAAGTLFLALCLGLYTGKHCQGRLPGGKGYILPGIILISLGVVNILW